MEMKNVKGCFDYSSEETKVRSYVKEKLSNVFLKYGYQELETAIVNYYDLLTLKYKEDDDIVKEIYKVSDQGGRALSLRYDLTVPFAKYVAMTKNITLPFRRFEIGKVFRDGPVKVGRNREFIQCDVDVVGIDTRLVDVELMLLYIDGFKALDIPIVIKYNNRKLTSGILIECGISEELISDVIIVLDKKNKISKEDFIIELTNCGLKKTEINKILRYLNYSFGELEKKCKEANILLQTGIKEVRELMDYIDKLGINEYVEFDMTLARGQSYYTGVVYEVYDATGVIKSSIGGGGRYDKMITNFIDDGTDYPAVGISFGLDVICAYLKEKKALFKENAIDIYLISIDDSIEALKLAQILRKQNYNVLIDDSKKKLKKSMAFADRENIRYVIVLGSDEIMNKKFTIKDMITGENKTYNYDEKIELKN